LERLGIGGLIIGEEHQQQAVPAATLWRSGTAVDLPGYPGQNARRVMTLRTVGSRRTSRHGMTG